jgi:hypothetical protein
MQNCSFKGKVVADDIEKQIYQETRVNNLASKGGAMH